jgi:hypothetical protein
MVFLFKTIIYYLSCAGYLVYPPGFDRQNLTDLGLYSIDMSYKIAGSYKDAR